VDVIRLLVARHGNTFESYDRAQATQLGEYLRANHFHPDVIYTSTLLRTIQTAELAFPNEAHQPLSQFDEIDYGIDENQLEDDVVARIGQDALNAWNHEAIVPAGWHVDTNNIIAQWSDFLTQVVTSDHRNVCVITSNGIARFLPFALGNQVLPFDTLKLNTGAFALLTYTSHWEIVEWNVRP
jgi:2,3-bisphosphoglycerate-dependent phosphoglycerate mutase